MKTLDYVIGCTDTTTGKTGCFTFNTDDHLKPDSKPGNFVATSPVFDSLAGLYDWANESGINLVFKP